MSENERNSADDPSGNAWRDVEVGEVLQHTDMLRDSVGAWVFTEAAGIAVCDSWARKYRRLIGPQQAEQ